MVDPESERAVSRWVRLGDEVAGRPPPDDRAQCDSCGTTDNVLDRGEHALCAHCYLERGAPQETEAPSIAPAQAPAQA